MIKKKILFLVLNKKVIDNFLSDHIKKLSQQYDIEFISSINSNKFYIDDICYKNIIVELKRSVNFINFIKNFFTILNYLKTSKPSLTISIHPRNGLLISFSKLF